MSHASTAGHTHPKPFQKQRKVTPRPVFPIRSWPEYDDRLSCAATDGEHLDITAILKLIERKHGREEAAHALWTAIQGVPGEAGAKSGHAVLKILRHRHGDPTAASLISRQLADGLYAKPPDPPSYEEPMTRQKAALLKLEQQLAREKTQADDFLLPRDDE